MNPSADVLKTMMETEADTPSKPTESQKHITAYDVEKLLSKSSMLSKGLLLQLRQSLTKEWGSSSVGILPKDSIQKLLTEVGFI